MKKRIRCALLVYDIIIYCITGFSLAFAYMSSYNLDTYKKQILVLIIGLCVTATSRLLFKIYQQIWRYASAKEFIRLLTADSIATSVMLLICAYLRFPFSALFVLLLFSVNLLICVFIRMVYQIVYQKRTSKCIAEKFFLNILRVFTGTSFADEKTESNRIKIAIIGAGSVGTKLADELIQNSSSPYVPVCFVDIDEGKAGREIYGIPVLNETNVKKMKDTYKVQEIIFALPTISFERRKELYELYKELDFKIKTYDYPIFNSDENGKRSIHDFEIEDLLFRSANQFLNEDTMSWYHGKSVLITGGGGSIGSELARQIAKCHPSRLVILDVYENGAYDVQQELRIKYGDELNLRIEIASVCDKDKIEKIFREHTPDIVLHAAAHKHVPLMERNVCEAVSNNVFGTLNVVEVCERFGVKRFIMVSTDKAVNPTNVMGATKRMCEMIVQSRSGEVTSFSATRFGNVLGSNGSVIPLFKRQIANGGPITVTDKRIIRYFMTIPEASQLVMTSGAMAHNGELYVLDMGNPVKILDLAENMVKLSGLQPYRDIDIIETGLRPGEKLYEELLIKTEELDKTNNDMIFIERDKPLSSEIIENKLAVLRIALQTQSNRVVKKALMEVVPTYHTPEEVNRNAIKSEEMRIAACV